MEQTKYSCYSVLKQRKSINWLCSGLNSWRRLKVKPFMFGLLH